ncbi:DinB family protein [Fulvivirga sp. 29W222]|uniref:DinB family protein n=1 Tax=Fulvivirga marina TaxID=2494733 RepID=A0A937FVV4_9BACT|nr:DinB family protein [Fulvivirga marina]MBL6445948.1 DinB family protein [Fulvivirga marina]
MASKLEELLTEASNYIKSTSPSQLDTKPSPEKWSKKEILGHLIDSAINNLQRFTEIQYSTKPYQVRPYEQDMLVKANNYQNADINELLNVWLALNTRIKEIITHQTEVTLNYSLLLPNGEENDLRFLIDDYVVHMAHHLKQIMA